MTCTHHQTSQMIMPASAVAHVVHVTSSFFYNRLTQRSSTPTLHNNYIFAGAVLRGCVYVWHWCLTYTAQQCHNSTQVQLNAVARCLEAAPLLSISCTPVRQLLETWDKASSQMWKLCFLGHHLDVSQNTSDYPPRVQSGRIRGRPCFEHGDVEERGLDAITTKGAQNQPWPCGGAFMGSFIN